MFKHDIGRVIEAAKASATTPSLKAKIENLCWYEGYAEPGYDEAPRGVMVGDWNDDHLCRDHGDCRESIARAYVERIGPLDHIVASACMDRRSDRKLMDRLQRVLEKLGVEVEWEDEWGQCDDCGKLVRTEPDSYGWEPWYRIVGGAYVCLGCIDEEPGDEEEDEDEDAA